MGGKPVYALNGFGPCSGSANAIREDVEKKADAWETIRDGSCRHFSILSAEVDLMPQTYSIALKLTSGPLHGTVAA